MGDRVRAPLLDTFLKNHEGKLAAERAAKRIRGVRAVANDIVRRVTKLVDPLQSCKA